MLELTRAPWTLADRVRGLGRDRRERPVSIDETQRVPATFDEVQRLIEDEGFGFVLRGSGVRKLMRGGANLPGG